MDKIALSLEVVKVYAGICSEDLSSVEKKILKKALDFLDLNIPNSTK